MLLNDLRQNRTDAMPAKKIHQTDEPRDRTDDEDDGAPATPHIRLTNKRWAQLTKITAAVKKVKHKFKDEEGGKIRISNISVVEMLLGDMMDYVEDGIDRGADPADLINSLKKLPPPTKGR